MNRAETPPLPNTLPLRRRVSLAWAGIRDRGIRDLPTDGQTPVIGRLLAQCQQGELAVMQWLVDEHAAASLPPGNTQRVRPTPPKEGPPGYPKDVWDVRRAAIETQGSNILEDREQSNRERVDRTTLTQRTATARAMVAVTGWATHYHEMCHVYQRSRLFGRKDYAGWLTPTYQHLSAFSLAPGLLADVNLHRTPPAEMTKEHHHDTTS